MPPAPTSLPAAHEHIARVLSKAHVSLVHAVRAPPRPAPCMPEGHFYDVVLFCTPNPVFTGIEAHCQLHIPLSPSSCSLQLFRARFLRSSGTGLPHIPRFPSQPLHLHVAKPHVWARSRLTEWSNQHFIQVDAFFKHFRRFGSRASLSLPRWPPLHHLSPPS